MKIRISCALLVAAILAGCQSAPQMVADKEDLLSAAGFIAKPATTAAQIAALKTLPANKLVQQSQNNKVSYLYADPVVCQCVYLGNQAAYSKYNQMVFQRNLAQDQEMATLTEENAFDYEPWGGFWGYW